MNKTAIRVFAAGARKKLTASVARRVTGLTACGREYCPGLSQDIAQKGLDTVVDEAAYVWFTRLIAVRFLEVNGYLSGGIRVLSSRTPGQTMPDIVAAAPEQERSDALFTALFLQTCHALRQILPDYFEHPCEYLDSLLDLSYQDESGVVRSLVDTVSEDDFKGEVEVVGWLYQYYNEERKNEAIHLLGGRVKREDVPAATQFFTTDWVVRYMVNNSLGKYWLERNPHSRLGEKLEFYLSPSGNSTAGNSQNEAVSPEDIKFLDPCMGSGHILVYAFDLLIEIYRECGYSTCDAAELILRKNLYGLDIDRRSYPLAYFALLMKARSYNQDILSCGVNLNLYEIRESNGIGEGLISYVANGDAQIETDLQKIMSCLYDACEYGSIVPVERIDFERVYRRMYEITKQDCGDLFSLSHRNEALEKLLPLVKQAEVMSGKYEVVATNPPYLNKMDKKLKSYVRKHYRDYSGDLFAVFMYRNFDFCCDNGYCAFMVPFVWMFIKTYEKLREFIIRNKSISSLIQLEYSAFEEATVPICTFVLQNGVENEPGVYLKLSDFRGGMEVQKQKVEDARNQAQCAYRFEVSAKRFAAIPGLPIAYWGSERFSELFTNSPVLGDCAVVTNGLFTCDNHRFLRHWYEVPRDEIFFDCEDRLQCEKSEKTWYPYNKGGDFKKWYGNHDYVVNFKHFGEEISAYRLQSGQSAAFPGQQNYFRPSISWSFVSSSKFGVRYYPAGFVFDIAGSSVFAADAEQTNYILGFLSSKVAFELLNLINPTLNYQAGNIAKLPIRIIESRIARVNALVAENIAIAKADWDSFETSWNFQTHPFIRLKAGNSGNGMKRSCLLKTSYDKWAQECDARFYRLKANEEELNRIFIALYGLQGELTAGVDEKEITVRKANLARDVRFFISYAVGCMFRRFHAEAAECTEPDWKAKNYMLSVTEAEGAGDIALRFVEFVKQIFGADTLEENLSFIAEALGNQGDTPEKTIRRYFYRNFYKDHVKLYQKRPIYWLLDSGKFQVLFYMHAYEHSTLEYAAACFAQEQARFAEAAEQKGLTAAQKETLLNWLAELEQYRHKLEKVAARHIPLNLDDGVLENYQKIQGGEILLAAIK